MTTCVRSLALAALSLGFAPAPFPKADTSEQDLRKMQGEWIGVSLTKGREKRPVGWKAIIKGHIQSYPSTGNEFVISLDTTVRPKRFQKSFVVGECKLIWRGIYRFEGNALILCYHSGDGEKPPTDFSAFDEDLVVEVWRRAGQ
jgi:uncharacterized protein (TIGR03067 family)